MAGSRPAAIGQRRGDAGRRRLIDASTPIIRRPAARVLLVDPASKVLLVRYIGREADWWIAPGGGLAELDLGPWIWRREHVFRWDDRSLLQEERYFLARVPHFTPRREGFTEDELTVLGEHRWWTVEEIERARERFAPRRLAAFLRRLLEQGPPAEPLDVGI